MAIDPKPPTSRKVELAVIIPSLHEADNLAILLPDLAQTLASLAKSYEIIVVDRYPDDATRRIVNEHQAVLLEQEGVGYGNALTTGFGYANSEFILTMDADLSHSPEFIEDVFRRRTEADVIIASRYVSGGAYKMPFVRTVLSKVLNKFFARGLSLNVRDMSSGFRLYKSDVLRSFAVENTDFAVLPEILVKAYCEGWLIAEVPFNYYPRQIGRSHARTIAFGISYLRTFARLYRLRNSILSADYDHRAYHSVLPPQRYWQRQRYKHITEMIASEGPVLDVGSGSSQIIDALSMGSVVIDLLFRKLRYLRICSAMRVQASGFGLPIRGESFPCVVCSQVIEHVPKNGGFLEELVRVLKPGGALILGTADYDNWQWRFIEAIYRRTMPSAYADEHISHYSRKELVGLFEDMSFDVEEVRYILKGELILKLRKPPSRL